MIAFTHSNFNCNYYSTDTTSSSSPVYDSDCDTTDSYTVVVYCSASQKTLDAISQEIAEELRREQLKEENARQFDRKLARELSQSGWIRNTPCSAGLRRDRHRHRPEQKASSYGHSALPVRLGVAGKLFSIAAY